MTGRAGCGRGSRSPTPSSTSSAASTSGKQRFLVQTRRHLKSEVRLKVRCRRSPPSPTLHLYMYNLCPGILLCLVIKAAVPDRQGRHHVQRHGGARAGHQTGGSRGSATSGCARVVMRRGDQVPRTKGITLLSHLFEHY
jgi:hypothetical protein